MLESNMLNECEHFRIEGKKINPEFYMADANFHSYYEILACFRMRHFEWSETELRNLFNMDAIRDLSTLVEMTALEIANLI